MILRNIEQYLVQDDENQTAYLRLPEGMSWWHWYGNDVEAMACYLKLLVHTSPQADVTSRLAKYLLNNRRHGSYWNSTRDTALCVEALAEFWRVSGEAAPDMTVELWIDGVKRKEVSITAENLFTFDASLVLDRDAVESGEHTIELRNAVAVHFTTTPISRTSRAKIRLQPPGWRSRSSVTTTSSCRQTRTSR